MKTSSYPAPLQLNGRDLPFVTTASHLGHELSQACNMDYDMKIRRARYIDRTTDVRDAFHFAHPTQILKAVDIYCGDNYGTMLLPLFDDSAEKYFRCWNRCVKLCWLVPVSTHTMLVENLLGAGFTSLRVNVMSRYVKFFQSLLSHQSKEISLIANIVGRDLESTTGKNLRGIGMETGLNLWLASSFQVKSTLNSLVKCEETDRWKLSLLENYLLRRQERDEMLKCTKDITELIDSLCST